jgi:hypothetical protein
VPGNTGVVAHQAGGFRPGAGRGEHDRVRAEGRAHGDLRRAVDAVRRHAFQNGLAFVRQEEERMARLGRARQPDTPDPLAGPQAGHVDRSPGVEADPLGRDAVADGRREQGAAAGVRAAGAHHDPVVAGRRGDVADPRVLARAAVVVGRHLAPAGIEQMQDRVGALGESPRLDQYRAGRPEPERDLPDDRCRGLPDHRGRCRRDGYGRHGSDGGEKSAGAEAEHRAE